MNHLHRNSWIGVLVAASALLQGCDPVPRRTLNTDEKAADIQWVLSRFGADYAPLDYKQSRFNFKIEDLKKTYLDASAQTKNNSEFYDLLFRLIAEFKDAHTSASLTNSSLPDRAKVAYLGFSGSREGDVLVVTDLLPTIAKNSAYPIEKGDKIVSVDGKKLKDVVKDEMVKFRDVGNEESNYTFSMNKIFTRVSTANGQPKSENAVLVVKRSDKLLNVTLPWVTKDLHEFGVEQAAAKSAAKKPATDSLPAAASNQLSIDDGNGNVLFSLNLIGFDGMLQYPDALMKQIARETRKNVSDGFKFVDSIAGWTSQEAATTPPTPAEALKLVRKIPSNAVFLSEAKTYPAYISREKSKTGTVTTTKLVGYILVDTFSPSGNAATVVKEFKDTLKAMQMFGVEDLIIDTLNNGGGSLILGMDLAQALSNEKIVMPQMQVRLNDGWLDQFQGDALEGDSDSEKENSRRLLNEMMSDQSKGNRLSERYSAEMLAPFHFKANESLDSKFKVVLLVNEMCASMCDIFAGILQDNKMATIVGTRSMGAGGNVVGHTNDQAPNSHLSLRQTESLMIRKDGTYLENNGVTPDVKVAVNESSSSKYDAVMKTALKVVFGTFEAPKE